MHTTTTTQPSALPNATAARIISLYERLASLRNHAARSPKWARAARSAMAETRADIAAACFAAQPTRSANVAACTCDRPAFYNIHGREDECARCHGDIATRSAT